jgi:hypothetical protein
MLETRILLNLLGLISGITTFYYATKFDLLRFIIFAVLTYIFFRTAIIVEIKRLDKVVQR